MEALGTLAAGVAHDLNNVLSGIVSYPDLLLMDIEPESALRKPIETTISTQNMDLKGKAAQQDTAPILRSLVALGLPAPGRGYRGQGCTEEKGRTRRPDP